jgi:hypothetical protein
MADFNDAVVSLGELSVSLHDCLAALQRRARLLPLLREVVVEEFLLQRAAELGLVVAREELQRAADAFRRRHGLTGAEQTQAWLRQQGLSVAAFEQVVERDLLLDKLKDHLFNERIAPHFEQHRADYDRLRLLQLTLPREDLARELLSQIRDEARDFTAVLLEHRADRVDGGGPWEVVLLRKEILPAVAAALPATAGRSAAPCRPRSATLWCALRKRSRPNPTMRPGR